MSKRSVVESWLHRWMGFAAGLVNLDLLLWRREWDQLPPENRRHPVRWWPNRNAEGRLLGGDEYWSAERVRDTLLDMREYAEGRAVAWFFVLGAGVLIGKSMFGCGDG